MHVLIRMVTEKTMGEGFYLKQFMEDYKLHKILVDVFNCFYVISKIMEESSACANIYSQFIADKSLQLFSPPNNVNVSAKAQRSVICILSPAFITFILSSLSNFIFSLTHNPTICEMWLHFYQYYRNHVKFKVIFTSKCCLQPLTC